MFTVKVFTIKIISVNIISAIKMKGGCIESEPGKF